MSRLVALGPASGSPPVAGRFDMTWPVAIAVLGLMTGPLSLLGFPSVPGQVGAVVVVLAAAVHGHGRGLLQVDPTSLLLLVPAAVAVLQPERLGDTIGGVGVFVPLALVAAFLPTFGRPHRPLVWPFAILGVVLAMWMAVLVVPAILDPTLGFYGVKGAASLPIGGGNFIGVVLLVALLFLLDQPRARWRTAGIGVLVVGLALALSRAAWLTAVVVLVARAVVARARAQAGSAEQRGRRTRRLVALGVVVMAAAALVMLLAITGGGDRLAAIVRPATGARLTIWQAGIEALGDNPLLGYGLYGFEAVAATVGRPENHPHNLELAAFGMFGLVGGVAYLAWWVLALRTAFGRRDGADRPLPSALSWAILALFLHAQLDAWSFHLPFEMLAVVLVALLRAPPTEPVTEAGTEPATGSSSV